MNVSSRFDVAGFGVIVTGGASGLGLAYGEVLAAHGARVTLIDVDGDAVAAQASRLAGEGLDVRGAVADVTDHAALDRAIDEAAETYGRLDVAFANAGIDPGVGFVGAWAGGAAAARRGGRARALHRRALEPRDRHQPQRDLRHRARRGPPHAPAPVRADHRDDVARRDQDRAARSAPPTWRRRPAPGTSCTCSRSSSPPTASPSTRSRPGFFVTNIGGGHAHNPEVQAALAKDIPMHRVGFPDDIKALALFLAVARRRSTSPGRRS